MPCAIMWHASRLPTSFRNWRRRHALLFSSICRVCSETAVCRVPGDRDRITHSLPSPAGTIGHVAHGKSTVVKAISGVQTVRFKNELERNITIKLGYANAKIFKAAEPRCPRWVPVP